MNEFAGSDTQFERDAIGDAFAIEQSENWGEKKVRECYYEFLVLIIALSSSLARSKINYLSLLL